MEPAETIFRSPLDKPLDQLTEEDISQLTREDCRRYLKEKGMRRPSWNKSQAIQQVISLKSLLETRTDSGAGIRQNVVSRPENQPQIPVTAEEQVSYRRKDPPKPAFSGNGLCRPPAADNNTISPRITSVANGPVGQMTIFYNGKVNVYNGVPADKAQTIMQLAASPVYLPQYTPSGGTTESRPFPCRQATCVRPGASSATSSPTLQNTKMAENYVQYREEGNMSNEVEPEGPTSRKASLQRYLEKRKDRFKSKRKIRGSSSLEVYLNHQVRSQPPNGQSSRSGTCSQSQPRLPHIPNQCSSVENQSKDVNLSVDLNDSGASDDDIKA